MTYKHNLFLTVAAVVCFAIATLLSIGMFSGDAVPWAYGGLAAFAAARLP